MPFQQKALLTFTQLKAAFEPFGLPVQETSGNPHSSTVKVMSSGDLQQQAFFSTPGRYEGILYLSHIDDGRFKEIEKLLGEHGMSFTPYKPDETLLKGPHTLVMGKDEWLTKRPLVKNIKITS